MSKLNHVFLIGAVTSAPTSKTFSTTASINFTVAGNTRVMDDQGQIRNPTFYQRVNYIVALDKLEETMAKIEPGRLVAITGRLEYREWGESKPRDNITEVKVLGIEFIPAGDHSILPDSIGGFRLEGGVCQVNLVGNLTGDAELRYTPSGDAVTNLRMAYNESYKIGEEWKTKPHFFSGEVWGNKAEVIAELKKGQPIYLSGRLSSDTYTDSAGKKRSRTTITVERIEQLERHGKNEFEEDLPF
jgi:single-strand DNA-binding protein